MPLYKASEKQIGFALALLGKAGFDTRFMNREFAQLGASMRQRSGTVEDWLSGMTRPEISNLIDDLKKRIDGKNPSR